MRLEVGKSYLTRHGRTIKIDKEAWKGVFEGHYKNDQLTKDTNRNWDRFLKDGRCWSFLTFEGELFFPDRDIIMEK